MDILLPLPFTVGTYHVLKCGIFISCLFSFNDAICNPGYITWYVTKVPNYEFRKLKEKGAVLGEFNVLSRHLLWKTEENQERSKSRLPVS